MRLGRAPEGRKEELLVATKGRAPAAGDGSAVGISGSGSREESVVDAELRLVAWNQRYLKLFGYPPGLVVIGRPIEDLMLYNASRGLLGNGISKVGSFAVSLILARLLVPHDFGVYAVALAAMQFGMHTASKRV